MKFWSVTHKHTSYITADTEAEACEILADSVRDNAVANECEAEEISEREFDQHWALIENGPHGANAPAEAAVSRRLQPVVREIGGRP